MSVPVKSWVEITLSGTPATRDEAVGLLIEAGSKAVIEGEFFTDLPSLKREKTERLQLKASIPAKHGKGSAESSALTALRAEAAAIGWDMDLSLIKDRDWSLSWRGGIRPVRISYRGSGLFIHTSWSKALKKTGEIEVVIDPSMAFGTGTHPTTGMCLKALLMLLGGSNNNRALSGGPVLDVGAGSAILMIAALKLGASAALGLEIDPLAIKVARGNLKINQVKARLSNRPISSLTQKFTIITANIFSEELCRLAPELVDRLGCASNKHGGFIVLSGILREQAPAVLAVYRALGMRVYKKFVSGEWMCIVLCRGADR